jgi:hypothetical protein
VQLSRSSEKEIDMNRLAVSTTFALAAAMAWFPSTTASGAGGGTIEGTVAHARGTGDLIVYVVSVPGQFPAPAEHGRIDQKKMTFIPHVLPILTGTTVDFFNSDPMNHNVFSPDNEGYNLGTWPKGDKRSYTFKRPGVYTQLCSIHPEMLAFVIALQNPYYATTKADGHFSIAGVPPGQYTLKVWGEKLKKGEKERTFPVKVTAGKASVSISF